MDFNKYIPTLPIQSPGYADEKTNLECLFYHDLLTELGIRNHPKAKDVFSLAWNYALEYQGAKLGHGFEGKINLKKVASYAEDMASLLEGN